MSQIWTSDDSDAIERLRIQYSTSLIYPPATMVGHVSAVPNHQTGRITPFKTRSDVAQMCNFGYELDVSRISDDEKEQIKEQVALHKRIEPMIYEGDFYRLASPFENEYCSWQIVSKDKKASFVVVAMQKASPHMGGMHIKLRGLDENTEYTVKELGVTLHGSTLMNAGIPITKEYKDFVTATFEIEAK
jgi:alpha-galactosidase